ncbi:MAG: hypothetical protein WBL63_00080, partial [Candidatus Acidiferrum sp.]
VFGRYLPFMFLAVKKGNRQQTQNWKHGQVKPIPPRGAAGDWMAWPFGFGEAAQPHPSTVSAYGLVVLSFRCCHCFHLLIPYSRLRDAVNCWPGSGDVKLPV